MPVAGQNLIVAAHMKEEKADGRASRCRSGFAREVHARELASSSYEVATGRAVPWGMGGAHEWSPMHGLIRAFALDVLNVVCGSTSQRREAGAVTPPLTAPASRLTLIEYCPIFGCAVAGYNDRALQFGDGKRATFCPERSSGES